jgi:hypothetical protein
MISRRRLTLQLTPLLDMLLILVFVQYFQLRDTERSVNAERDQLIVERDQLAGEQAAARLSLEDLSRRLEEVRAQLIQASRQASDARSLAENERQAAARSEGRLDQALAQQHTLGELVNELFQIPPDEFSRLLDSARSPSLPENSLERDRLTQRWKSLASQSPGRVIEHLLSYEEIRKRCDVWTLHIDAQGILTLSDGTRTAKLRIPLTAQDDVNSEALVNDLFHWYRTLPQAKSLVVILLTYDRDARIYLTEAIRLVLPVWAARMQADAAGRSRFEYADLGFRLE